VVSESPTQVVYQDQQPVLVLRAAELRALSGPDAGAVCSLELHRVGVGTATDNQLVLSDPLVSRHHLELQVQDRGYLVRDLGSTNGTFYRGARIQEAVLGVGAEVRLGSTVLRVEKAPSARS
jgi:pSer/pThr/pTyr-binding forkhead associated (FHA) protein